MNDIVAWDILNYEDENHEVPDENMPNLKTVWSNSTHSSKNWLVKCKGRNRELISHQQMSMKSLTENGPKVKNCFKIHDARHLNPRLSLNRPPGYNDHTDEFRFIKHYKHRKPSVENFQMSAKKANLCNFKKWKTRSPKHGGPVSHNLFHHQSAKKNVFHNVHKRSKSKQSKLTIVF